MARIFPGQFELQQCHSEIVLAPFGPISAKTTSMARVTCGECGRRFFTSTWRAPLVLGALHALTCPLHARRRHSPAAVSLACALGVHATYDPHVLALKSPANTAKHADYERGKVWAIVLNAPRTPRNPLADCGCELGDWRSGSAFRSHRRGRWFEPSIAHPMKSPSDQHKR